MYHHVFVLASFLRFNPFISTEKYFVNTNLYRIPLKNCHATYLKLDFCQRPKVEWTNIYWSCSSRWIWVWISLSISISQIIKPYFINLLVHLSIIYPPQTLKPVLALFSSKWWNILTTSPASCASTAPRGQSCTCRWHRETSFAGSSSSLPVLGKTSPSNVSVRPFLAWSVVASVSTMTQT